MNAYKWSRYVYYFSSFHKSFWWMARMASKSKLPDAWFFNFVRCIWCLKFECIFSLRKYGWCYFHFQKIEKTLMNSTALSVVNNICQKSQLIADMSSSLVYPCVHKASMNSFKSNIDLTGFVFALGRGHSKMISWKVYRLLCSACRPLWCSD